MSLVCQVSSTSTATISQTFPDESADGERDPKSLLLASISDTNLLKQFLSTAPTNTTTTAAATPLNAAATSPSTIATPPQLQSPVSRSAGAESLHPLLSAMASSPSADQSMSVLNGLSRRLNSLLVGSPCPLSLCSYQPNMLCLLAITAIF